MVENSSYAYEKSQSLNKKIKMKFFYLLSSRDRDHS